MPPALMAMATFVQAYLGVSDAEMVELTVVDLRLRMVLDCLGASKPAFSQGALCDFARNAGADPEVARFGSLPMRRFNSDSTSC